MLYDIDSFGFVPGFLHGNWSVMSEEDLMQNKKLRKSLASSQYKNWKRHNITELMSEYDEKYHIESFVDFCKLEYSRILNDELTE